MDPVMSTQELSARMDGRAQCCAPERKSGFRGGATEVVTPEGH